MKSWGKMDKFIEKQLNSTWELIFLVIQVSIKWFEHLISKLSLRSLQPVMMPSSSISSTSITSSSDSLNMSTDTATQDQSKPVQMKKAQNVQKSKGPAGLISNCTNLKVDQIQLSKEPPVKCLMDYKNIPGPFSLPFFGTTLTSGSKGITSHNLRETNEINSKKYGPIMKEEYLFNYPIIVLYDADDIEAVNRVPGSYRPVVELITMYRKQNKHFNGIANDFGDSWHFSRKAISPVMTRVFNQTLFQTGDEIVNEFVQNLKTKGPVIKEFYSEICNIVIEYMTYGIYGRRVGQSDDMKLFQKAHQNFWTCLHESYYGFPWWKYLPSSRLWNKFCESETQMLNISKGFLDEEIKRIKNGEEPSQRLVNAVISTDFFSHSDKAVILSDLIVSGLHPVSNSIFFTLYCISRNPGAQVKVQEELGSVMPTKDSSMSADLINKMPYLRACIKESFRLYPTTPNLARIFEKDLVIRDYKIPAWSVVIEQSWHACLQDCNFYKAKEFLPERWILDGSNKPKYTPHRKGLCLHFGSGRHGCPGKRFSMQEMIIITARILRNFRMEFDEIELIYNFLQMPKLPVKVKIEEFED